MKKNKFVGTAALLLFAMFNSTILPVYADVTDFQTADTSAEETNVECQVIYKSTYDFSEEIPKYPELDVTVSGYEGTYDGKSHGINVGCRTDGVSILYSTDGKTYSRKKPEYRYAGTYVTYYRVEKAGYNTITGSAIVRIREAVIEFDADDCTVLYDGKKHGIYLSVKTGGCQILYSEDGINFTSRKPEYKEPGTYVVYYKIMKDNYATETGSKKVIIKENDNGIILPGVGETIKVGDTISVPVDTGGNPFEVTVSDTDIISVSVKNDVISVTGLKEGTATITITSNGKTALYKVRVIGNGTINTGNTDSSKHQNTGSHTSNVQTGDESNIFFYVMMLMVSAFGLTKLKRREKRKW